MVRLTIYSYVPEAARSDNIGTSAEHKGTRTNIFSERASPKSVSSHDGILETPSAPTSKSYHKPAIVTENEGRQGTMDRPSGPLGAATQSSRPMGDNGSSRPAPLNTARRIPNGVRHAASSSSLVSNSAMVPREIPISAGQFVTLAKEAMKNALEENQTKAAEASAVSTELKPGVTIDLSHRRIEQFPDEVVDIIKNELERYSLSCPTAGLEIGS